MTTGAAAALADLAERYWRFECHETPLAAALAGERTADPVLFRESIEDHARRDAEAASLLARLDAIDAGALGDDAGAAQRRATHALLRRELDGIRAKHAVGAHLRPSLLPLGPEFVTVYFANTQTLTDADGAALYAERLAALPAYLADLEEAIDAGHARGYRYPRPVADAAAAAARAIAAATAETSPWLAPFDRAPKPFADARAQALRTIGAALLPALGRWAAFLADRVAPAAKEALACAEDDGDDHYRVLVRWFTTRDDTPETIHALGHAEVARLEGEMAAVAAEAGFAGDLPGYRRFIVEDASLVAGSATELRRELQILCKEIDGRIPAFFSHLPRATYGVESIPEVQSERMPPAYAQPSSADGGSAGVLWVSGLPRKCPRHLLPALAVHEAWPGHLMHIALLQEATDLPAFRRHGSIKYSACVEGWALYCETLGLEMGVYRTPHEHFGRLDMQIWRAVRLVVDTGIHAHGWTRQAGVDFMRAHTTLAPETIEAEVDRYAGMPGQALSYHVGGMTLHALRTRAEAALGTRFRHRDFHAAVTGAGAVTLPVLEALVDGWLQAAGRDLG